LLDGVGAIVDSVSEQGCLADVVPFVALATSTGSVNRPAEGQKIEAFLD